jgi:hypothetical protein
LPLPSGLFAWIGYQEIWDLEDGRSPFVFRQASITIHAGDAGDPVKPQLFRLEWPGLKNWDRTGIGFQASGAGHPHWQFDMVESLVSAQGQIFDPEKSEVVEEFKRNPDADLEARILSLSVERMHLASAAPWWLAESAEFGAHHLNAPGSVDDLARWFAAALAYIKQELGRCEAR